MSEYVILECGRKVARKTYRQVDEDNDVYKNKWTNNVSSTGIEINRGDVINLEQSAINTSGTVQDSIEIIGSDTENNIKDNKFSMDVDLYITNSGFNGIPMPMKDYITYVSDGLADFTLLKNTRNRGIGEWYPTTDPIKFLNNFVINVTEGGSGFQENGLYTASSNFAAHPTNQDITLKAIKVEAGELILAELTNIDYGILSQMGTTPTIFPATGVSPTPNPTAFATMEIATTDPDVSSVNYIRPDNRRYFPTKDGFSGIGYKASVTGTPSWSTELNPTFSLRTKNISIEIDEGLKTPQTISTEITKQIQNTTNENKSRAGGLAYENQATSVWSVNNVNPTYTDLLDESQTRKLGYSQLAYENPQKYEGLQWSRQFYYGLNNDDPLNEINSGNNQLAASGDYFNQTVGDHGLNMCMTNFFTNVGGLIEMGPNNIIITNVYFTEANIAKIAAGFKLAEVNCGLYSSNSTSKLDMGVPLDCGLYVDQFSDASLPSSGATGVRKRFITPQEAATHTPGLIYTTTDQGFGASVSTNHGTQFPYFEGDSSTNDGQQLSQLVVRSRYADIPEADWAGALFKLKAASVDPNNLKVPASATEDTVFRGDSYEELIALSKKYDVACYPMYPDSGNGEWYKNGKPYICFVSKISCTQTSSAAYDQNTQLGWKIDSKNFFDGIQLGLDTSFIRNRALFMVNNTRVNNEDIFPELIAGAYNLQFQYDTNTSRFFMSDMNTNLKDGNGQPYENTDVLEYLGLVSDAPDQQVFGVNLTKTCYSYINRSDPYSDYTFDFKMKSNPNEIIDTLTGVSLRSLYLYDANGNVKITQNYYDDELQSLDGSLLDKMGFEMNQLFNLIGTIQTRFKTDNVNTSISNKLQNNTRPLTQNSIVGVSEINATQTNGSIPLYLTGIGIEGNQATPQTVQNKLLATNLPSQLDYPYLCVYSSIIRGGVLSKYMGGPDSQQLLNCMGYITRYNNEGSFFYGSESSFQYTATKDFVLSEIETDIRLPDGTRPRLSKNSSVIYKITKPLPNLPGYITSKKR